MGKIVYAGFAPHPPLLVDEIGGRAVEQVKYTVKSMEKMAEELVKTNPDTLIIISPHSAVLRDAVGINMEPKLKGSLAQFGAPQVKFEKENDLELGQLIIEEASAKGVRAVSLNEYSSRGYLDHGTTVPLYYFDKKGLDAKLIVISMSFLSLKDNYTFGTAIRTAVHKSTNNAAVIASGDLSHKLIPGAPAGYDEKGKEFDLKIKTSLENNSFIDILEMPEELSERAGECGLRPLVMVLGALEGLNPSSNVLSYEGPFGVGYLVASFNIKNKANPSSNSNSLHSLPVKIAKKSLEYFLREGKIMPVPEDIEGELLEKAGVFVSIKKKGKLRGCIGTVEPIRSNFAEEIIHNAVKAGVNDPRFQPVKLEEIPELDFSVDVLLSPEPVEDLSQLNPKEFGIIVKKGPRKGLLLPDLEGIETVQDQLAAALRKANIDPSDDYTIQKFRVKRLK